MADSFKAGLCTVCVEHKKGKLLYGAAASYTGEGRPESRSQTYKFSRT